MTSRNRGGWINTAATGRWMESEMAKETEGQRRQEVKDRQLVKGRGGSIGNRQETNAGFLSMYSTHRNLHRGNEEEGKEVGRAGGRVQSLNGDVEGGSGGKDRQ